MLTHSQIKMNLFHGDRDRLNSCSQASFLIAAVLGNTGFIGLAIAPFLIDSHAVN
jgi:hypothetical protein